jgi:hypothetical protein
MWRKASLLNEWFEFVASANEAAGAGSWLSLSEFTDRFINSGMRLDGGPVASDESSRQRVAFALGQITAQLITLGVYRTRDGVRYTANLGIPSQTAEARPTRLGLRLFHFGVRKRKAAILGLLAVYWIKSAFYRGRWVIVAGSTGFAVIKAVLFYKIALTEISSEEGWLVALIAGIGAAMVAAVIHRLH